MADEKEYGIYGNDRYIPSAQNADWSSGGKSERNITPKMPTAQFDYTPDEIPRTNTIGIEKMTNQDVNYRPASDVFPDLKKHEQRETFSTTMERQNSMWGVHTPFINRDPKSRNEMFNLPEERISDGKKTAVSRIQNQFGFPAYVGTSNGYGQYDYRTYPVNTGKINTPTESLEQRMMKARAAFGIQVHGDRDIARSVKYYMYNRFKVPDTNLAFNKSFTHVFFTRPDLHLLEDNGEISNQAKYTSETAMIFRRHPDLFKLLTDRTRCKDYNNFNMLLSNQIASFQMKNEDLTVMKVGKSWNDHQMSYGGDYTGRNADQFSCTFTETKDLSITNLIKLWMTYIDLVSRGAFLPNYGEDHNEININKHVLTRTLDYASSCYVIITGEDGEDILYWSKYYGIFPISSGASALSWESGEIGSPPKLDITFAYSWKLDLNPISLMEFNFNSGISGATWDQSFNQNVAHSTRPFVTCPYIEFSSLDSSKIPSFNKNVVTSSKYCTGLRLKFIHNEANAQRSDSVLYRANPDK